MKLFNGLNPGINHGTGFRLIGRGIYRKKLKFRQTCFLVISIIILTAACRHKQTMNKSGAEKALLVFNSELLGTAFGIMHTEGWGVFSGLLKSDSIPVSGNIPISDSPPINLSPADNIFSAVFQKIPLNFNQEYVKNGKKVCAINYYYKINPDSSFYIRKVIFIKPCSLEMKCLCITDKLHHSGHINLVVSGRDTAGNFLEGRIRAHMITGNKGFLQADAMHADVKLFGLFFSADTDFSRMKPGSREMWSDFIRNCSIEVSDYSSGQYLGRLVLAEKDKGKNRDFLFVFSDGSREPASAYFSWLGRLALPF
jgi:hypothetical protein